MTMDGFEALRLADYEGLTMEEGAARMTRIPAYLRQDLGRSPSAPLRGFSWTDWLCTSLTMPRRRVYN